MNKTIPTKNYIILLTIVLITVVAVFYARSWYNTTRKYNAENSIMLTAINEINPDELSNYILENSKFVLYTSSGENENIKAFENQFKNVIIKNNIEDSVIYINTANINNEELADNLKNYTNILKNNININDNVSMYFFDDGQIIRVINNANDMNIKQITKLLKKYGVIDNA